MRKVTNYLLFLFKLTHMIRLISFRRAASPIFALIFLSLSFTCISCQKEGFDYPNGQTVVVVSSPGGELTTLTPVNEKTINKGRTTVRKSDFQTEGAVFHITDKWTRSDGEITLSRHLEVEGDYPGAGFYSEEIFHSAVFSSWEGSLFMIPGTIYGKPHTTAYSKGGANYFNAGFFSLREDYLPAPMVAVATPEGKWAAILNTCPDGYTTQQETSAGAADRIVDGKLAFGALDIRKGEQGVDLVYRFPGSDEEFSGRGAFSAPAAASGSIIRGRFHPVQDGFTQDYTVAFKTGLSPSFPQIEREVWRWTWSRLDPKVEPVDIEMVKNTLLDHLNDRLVTYHDRTGIPFVIDAVSGKPGSFRPSASAFRRTPVIPDLDGIVKWADELGIDIDPSAAELDIWPWAVVGFCGKHVELAGQFLRESYRDASDRGMKFRKNAEAIMNTLVNGFPVNPPIGEGFDLRTGKAGNIHGGNSFALRPIPEDMSMLMELLAAEKEHGRTHDEWLAWGKEHAEWLLSQQREDGSFPADWGTDGNISDPSGEKTYAPIPFFVRLSAFTGENQWLDSALKAGEALWNISGNMGYYSGATGNSQVADKESGMLSLNAFLSLYDATKDSKWLDRAIAAADYTESWIWIWNVPMPEGADPAGLGWKPGVPTIGVNSIGSNDVGGVDQYLDWAVPLYAQLYKLTGDDHYLDVAYILLHGTKAMLALPGRTYDMAGPGWQQEHWRMALGRGTGAHRTWLPWISINHIHGITGLEDLDPELYERMKHTLD